MDYKRSAASESGARKTAMFPSIPSACKDARAGSGSKAFSTKDTTEPRFKVASKIHLFDKSFHSKCWKQSIEINAANPCVKSHVVHQGYREKGTSVFKDPNPLRIRPVTFLINTYRYGFTRPRTRCKVIYAY